MQEIVLYNVTMHDYQSNEPSQQSQIHHNLRSSNGDKGELLSPAQIVAFSICLTAAERAFQTFVSLQIEAIQNLPMFYFIRVVHATIGLINMYFIAVAPQSKVCKVTNKDDIKVEYYLDCLLNQFRVAAQDDKSRRASKFFKTLETLKIWYFHEEAKIAMNPNDTDTSVDCENQLPCPSWTDRPPTEAELQLESQPSSYHSLTSGDLTEEMAPETVTGSTLQQEMGSTLADAEFQISMIYFWTLWMEHQITSLTGCD